MYQGKFDAKSRGVSSPDETLQDILEKRNAAIAEKKAKEARKAAMKSQQNTARTSAPGVSPSAPAGSPVRKAPPKAPVDPAVRRTPPKQPIPDIPQSTKTSKKSKKKGSHVGTVIFYTLYFLMILLFAVATVGVLFWLKGWLADYEAAQPTIKCQEVFEQLFDHPDWGELYDMAGIQNTDYEGRDQYVSYMKDKVGDKKLTFVETSAGLSGDKKYIVRLDNEKIATFTLEGKGEKVTDIPDWKLGKVELFFSRQQGYLIQSQEGHTVFVNGVALTDDFIIQIASTKADEYLPAGVTSTRSCIQKIDGLMAKPTVTVFSPTGEGMSVVFNEETGMFVEQTSANTMTSEEEEVTLGAMKAYAEFMINASGARAAVAKYYDGSSQTYNDILKMASELWMNSDYGHSFSEETLDGYSKYSDDRFSVHGRIIMNVNCKDGTKKDFVIDQSYFFHKKGGKWVCYETTNEDISQPVGQVRLTFMNNGEVLSSEFYKTNATSLECPVVSVPDGKVFSGWVREDLDENGKRKLTVVFTPDENGKVTMAPGSSLEPMTLYPLFDNAE